MIKLKSLICEAKVPIISLQQAVEADLFGPVYHGTKAEYRDAIGKEGFKVVMGMYGTSGMSQGYQPGASYGNTGVPPPIHHLGFGVYFTTSKGIAKKFAGGTAKGMKTYFLKIPKLETINWGSERTMMKWWIKNGYDPEIARRGEGGRYLATAKLTEELKSQWDAVWYKGKGIYTLLDGDQVCVYEPEGKIFEIDLKLSTGYEIGSRVRAKHDITYYDYEGKPYRHIPGGTKGIILKRNDAAKAREMNDLYWAKRAQKWDLQVKFEKGGVQQVEDVDIEPLVP